MQNLEVKETVYELIVSWANDGITETTTTIYADYEDAKNAYEESMHQCIYEDCSEMFSDKENKIAADGYGIEENNKIFFVFEEGYAAGNFEQIELREQPVYTRKKENN